MEGKNRGQKRRESSEDLYGDYGMLFGEWERKEPDRQNDLFSETSYSAIFASKAALYGEKEKELYGELYGEIPAEKKADAADGTDTGNETEETPDPAAQKKRDRIVFLTAMGVILVTLLIAGTSVQRIIRQRSEKTLDEQIEEVVLQQELENEPFQGDVPKETMALVTRPEVSGAATADLSVDGWRGFVLRSATYADASDAEYAAKRAQTQGYAGYLIRRDDWELYAEAYLDEDEANRAASSAGTTRVDLSVSAQTLTITGSEYDVTVLKEALVQWPGLIKSLTTAVKKASSGDISKDEAMISVKEIEAQISGTIAELQKTDVHGNLWAYEVFEMYADAERGLSDIVEEGSLSGPLAWSRLRSACVGMYWNYYDLVREFQTE